jgi:mRNA-degrading endonuclease RelE of RelBE toxin-antitoxin system
MSYAVVWGPEAEADYAQLPPLVQSKLLDAIDELASDPVRLSVRSHFPYRIDRQLYWASVKHEDGRTYHINVLFRYVPDETTIYLTEIAWQAV